MPCLAANRLPLDARKETDSPAKASVLLFKESAAPSCKEIFLKNILQTYDICGIGGGYSASASPPGEVARPGNGIEKITRVAHAFSD